MRLSICAKLVLTFLGAMCLAVATIGGVVAADRPGRTRPGGHAGGGRPHDYDPGTGGLDVPLVTIAQPVVSSGELWGFYGISFVSSVAPQMNMNAGSNQMQRINLIGVGATIDVLQVKPLSVLRSE